jgi:predicted PurR-regulated permease PerM
MVASIGGGVLLFVAAFIVAGIIMAFGREGEGASAAIFARIFGPARGATFTKLSVATVRAVAQGVIGIAAIVAIAIGLILLVAKVPFAGVLALIVLVLGIAQIPAVLVTIPVIIYIWASGNYSNVAAIVYTILLALAGISDNFLKPLLLGRGVDAPMPVILLGALGGMAVGGILGLFVGAVLLALGYQIFMMWVRSPDAAVDPGSAPTNPST